MTENVGKHVQEDSTAAKQSPDGATDFTDKQSFVSFFQHGSNSTLLVVAGLLILSVLGIGFLLSQQNQYDQVPVGPLKLTVTTTEPQPTTIQSTATPTIDTSTPTASPTASVQPVKPLATKKPAKPTPTPITGVDLRFVDVFFYPVPEPNKAFTPWRVANGGSITVSNERNVGEFKLNAVLVNYGTEESKNIWVHYFIDGSQVQKGIAYLPGNMVADELVTRDSAQPVKLPNTGTHTIKIVIDPDNQSSDVNTANNTYTFTYSVK